MGKGRIVHIYRSMSPSDQHIFRWWAKANAVFGAMIVAGLLTASAISSSTPSFSQVAAKRVGPAEVSREAKLATQPGNYESRR